MVGLSDAAKFNLGLELSEMHKDDLINEILWEDRVEDTGQRLPAVAWE